MSSRTLAPFLVRGGLFVLTGAGISTESGIPDYRRPDGTRRSVPMTFQEFMASEHARQRYWIRSAVGWERFAAARVNSGHTALAALQRAGLLDAVVTQNVDGLHQEAGTRDVIELHGSLARVVCVTCGARTDRSAYQARLRENNPALPATSDLLADGDADVDERLESDFVLVPCEICGSTMVKPDVVMFGQSVAPELVQTCYDAVDRSRAVLVLGSSLKVMSGYRFVRAAVKAGKPVALVGLGLMRGEETAQLVVRQPLGQTLQGVCRDLGLIVPATPKSRIAGTSTVLTRGATQP